MDGFKVVYRNFGHWDIYAEGKRAYRIRGGPGKYWISGDYDHSDEPSIEFKSVSAAMTYICDKLMFELIIADGQTPTKIESWNV